MAVNLVYKALTAVKNEQGESKANLDEARFGAQACTIACGFACVAIAGLALAAIDNVVAALVLCALCILLACAVMASFFAESFCWASRGGGSCCCWPFRTRPRDATDDMGTPLTVIVEHLEDTTSSMDAMPATTLTTEH
jgi:hypothetical protein